MVTTGKIVTNGTIGTFGRTPNVASDYKARYLNHWSSGKISGPVSDLQKTLAKTGQRKTRKMAPKVNPVKDFISGGVGGVCLVVAGHPFDTLKVGYWRMKIYVPKFQGLTIFRQFGPGQLGPGQLDPGKSRIMTTQPNSQDNSSKFKRQLGRNKDCYRNTQILTSLSIGLPSSFPVFAKTSKQLLDSCLTD